MGLMASEAFGRVQNTSSSPVHHALGVSPWTLDAAIQPVGPVAIDQLETWAIV